MSNQYSRPIKFLFSSYKEHKKLFFFLFLTKIFEIIFSVGLPLLAKLEMDQLTEKNEQLFGIIEANSFNIFIIILIIIFIGQFIQNFINSFLEYCNERYLTIYENDFTYKMLSRLQNATPWIFLNERNKRIFTHINSSANRISWMFQNIIIWFLTNTLTFLGISTILISIDWKIFIILIITTITLFYLQKYKEIFEEKRRIWIDYENEYKIHHTKWELSDNTQQIITSWWLQSMINSLHKFNTIQRKEVEKSGKFSFIINIFEFIVSNISEISLKLIVGFSVFAGTTTLGTMTMTLLYIEKIHSIFDFFRTFLFHKNRLLDELARFNIFLELTEKTKNDTIKNKNFEKIIFENIHFSYPNFAKQELKYLEITEKRLKKYMNKEMNDEQKEELQGIMNAKKELSIEPPAILKGINLTFETGKTYGIVGKNGAWKTTIISLLQNFFENFSGKIHIDNTDIRKFDREFFEKNIAIIQQVPYIINNFSIRENILFGVEKEYSDKEIFTILKKFGLDKKIQKNPQWLDAEIGYNSDFSGWEKQIIALTRVILQDKKILILDEWTDQLDAENELLIMNELLKNKKDKIVIFITHRMTSIRKVDTIFCLKNGKIEASGTHNELIDNENIYNFFWKTQVEN